MTVLDELTQAGLDFAFRFAYVLLACSCACAPDLPATSDGPEYYEGRGTIVSIEGEYVLIDHEDIPGFMDSMTMTFPVTDPSVLEGLEQGARVKFRVVVDGASYVVDELESIARGDTPSERD